MLSVTRCSNFFVSDTSLSSPEEQEGPQIFCSACFESVTIHTFVVGGAGFSANLSIISIADLTDNIAAVRSEEAMEESSYMQIRWFLPNRIVPLAGASLEPHKH